MALRGFIAGSRSRLNLSVDSCVSYFGKPAENRIYLVVAHTRDPPIYPRLRVAEREKWLIQFQVTVIFSFSPTEMVVVTYI